MDTKEICVIVAIIGALVGVLALVSYGDHSNRQDHAKFLMEINPNLKKDYDLFMRDEWMSKYELETLKYLAIRR